MIMTRFRRAGSRLPVSALCVFLFSVVAFSVVAFSVIDLAIETRQTMIQGEEPQREQVQLAVSFHEQIRPIFQTHCQGCHQPAKRGGGYVMTTYDQMLKGGESESPAIQPGDVDGSYLVDLVTPEDGEAEMPKGKPPLSEAEIELIRRWIEQGAKDDSPANAMSRFDADHPPLYSAPPIITSIDYSPDGQWLAVAGFQEVLLHKADGSELVARLVGRSQRIESVRFSPDGKRLVAAGGNPGRMGEIQIWDVDKRELLLSHAETYDTIYGANWSPDGKLISFGCADNTVRVIEADSGKQVLFQGSHNDWVRDTVFSVEGDHVISVGRDMTAKLTELKTERFIDNITSITPKALKGGLASVDRHPTGDAIVVGGADGEPKIYRVKRESKRVIGDDANLIKRLPSLPGRIIGVAFSPDGKRVAAGSSLDGAGEVAIYEVSFEVKLPENLKKIVEKVERTRSAEERKTLEDSRTSGIKLLGTAKIEQGGVYSVAFSPDSQRLAVVGSDGKVHLLDANNASPVSEFVPVPLATPDQLATLRSAETVAETKELDTQAGPTEKPQEVLPAGVEVVGLEVAPSRVEIQRPFDSVQVIVSARLATGDVVDVTRAVERTVKDPMIQLSATGLIRAAAGAGGETQIVFSLAGRQVTLPVALADGLSEQPISYIRDVNPVVSKLGCNAGTCHGSKDGKNGFKLSLRGYDAIYDIRALTDDLASRRISTASPENSLMLLKATGAVPHVGGQLTRPGQPSYEVLRRWIENGAKLDMAAAHVTGIELSPINPIVQRVGASQQVRVVATYSDGSRRDVTAEAFVESGNRDVVTVDESALVSTARRGEAPILARFEGAYAATTITVMGDRDGFQAADQPANNFIDPLVADKWQRMKIQPSGLCTDAEFIRRVYLDLTGVPPTAAEVKAFVADERETRQKRDELVDRLIGSPDFVDHWTNKWADLLQVNRKFLGQPGAQAFRDWIRQEVADNTPYDQFAYKILTASGSNRENPAASYYKILRTPQETMENTTHLFLAVRFNCNKCHDHPFERWTQDQYYETAAYFAQYDLKPDPESKGKKIGGTAVEGAKPLYEIVVDKQEGDITHDRTGEVTSPQFPYEAAHEVASEASRRERLARWITSPDNQYFATSYVNRIWGYLLGVGLIEPLDDIRAGNPPSNPALLEALTKQFVESGFDTRQLMATICKSRTYQLSIETNTWNADDRLNYSHAMAKRLPAEVLYDAIHRVTGSQTKIPGVPAGTRAAALPDAGVRLADGFLQNFGRPVRESACECERTTGMQLGPVMALVSGPTLSRAISDPENALAKLAASDVTDEELIVELFWRILNRPATPDEVAAGVEMIRSIPMEHQQLVTRLAEYREELVPIVARREEQRQAAIAEAEAALAAYEKEIAPRVAQMEKEKAEKTAKLKEELKAYEATLPEKLQKWEGEQLAKQTVWVPLDPSQLSSTFGAKLTKEKDLSVFVTEKNGVGSYQLVAETDLIGITAIRIELLADKRLPRNGPGRADDGNFVFTELTVNAASRATPDKLTPVGLQNAKSDFNQANFEVAKVIDGDVSPNNGWATAPRFGQDRIATFELKQPLGDGAGTVLHFDLKQLFNSKTHSIGKFRISVTNSPLPANLQGIPRNLAQVFSIPTAQRNAQQQNAALSYFRGVDGELKKRQTAVADSEKPLPVDPKLVQLQDNVKYAMEPVPRDATLVSLERAVELSAEQVKNPRLVAAQDVAWALINSPAFLFNR